MNAGSVVPALTMFAETYGQSARSSMRPVRSSWPLSSSWLPIALTSRSMAFRASIVGESCWMSEVKVEAPTLSPTLAKIVFGLASR
jgi:hypothetical protein